ncbi:hypothetical protein D3C73_469930 [compost metagenome]
MSMNQRIQQHMRNFRFLLITFATGTFYFCFYLVGITFGVAMAFTLVGLPIIHYVLRSTHTFMQYERIHTRVYTGISIDPIPSRTRSDGNLWEQVKTELLDARNWRAIFSLMQKFLIGLVSITSAALLYVTPLLFLLVPFFYRLSYISILGMEIRTLGASLLTMLAGVVLTWIGSYLGNRLVMRIGGYTRRMVEELAGKGTY